MAPEYPVSPDLTPREAARRLGTSQATIWQMISDGRLPSYSLSLKRGAARRIRWEAIEAIRRGDDPVKAVRDADRAIVQRLEAVVPRGASKGQGNQEVGCATSQTRADLVKSGGVSPKRPARDGP